MRDEPPGTNAPWACLPPGSSVTAALAPSADAGSGNELVVVQLADDVCAEGSNRGCTEVGATVGFLVLVEPNERIDRRRAVDIAEHSRTALSAR
jgi:hypothetical protein